MTRKDYEKLANGFGKAYALAFGNELQIEGVWSAIRVTMSALQDDNPRFNHDRFIAAIQKSFELQSEDSEPAASIENRDSALKHNDMF